MGSHLLVLGSCADAPDLLPDWVGRCALAVTSPPYHNAISYDSHAADAKANYRRREAVDYAREYLPMLNSAWDACHAMLRPGGVLAINAGTVLEDGHHYPLPQDILHQCLSRGPRWAFVRSILWHKVTAGVRRAGSVIKHGLPGYWYPNIMTEHIILLKKPGAPLRVNRSRETLAWHSNIWDFAPVPPGTVDHPAPFPEELPHRLVRLFTKPGDAVLDPFCGSGTSVKTAAQAGRFGIGIDIEPSYIRLAERRLGEPSRIRPRQLRIRAVPRRDFVPGRSRGATRHGAGLSARAAGGGA